MAIDERPLDVGPRLAAIGGLENADAGKRVKRKWLARAYVNCAGIVGVERDGANRQSWLRVSERDPVLAAIGGLPNTAIGRAKIDDGGIGGINRKCSHASREKVAEVCDRRRANRGPLRGTDGQAAKSAGSSRTRKLRRGLEQLLFFPSHVLKLLECLEPRHDRDFVRLCAMLPREILRALLENIRRLLLFLVRVRAGGLLGKRKT